MKCPNCGKELAEDTRFCDECGCRIPEKTEDIADVAADSNDGAAENAGTVTDAFEQNAENAPGTDEDAASDTKPEPEEKPGKKPLNKKLIYIAAAAAAVLLVLITVICLAAAGGRVTEVRGSQFYFVPNEDNTMRVYFRGRCVGGKQDFMGLNEETWSDDGLNGIIIASDDMGERGLYTVGTKKIVRCDTDPITVEAISPDGKKGVYTKNGDSATEVYALSVKKGTKVKIDETDRLIAAAYSPNGRYLAYIADDGEDVRYCIYNGRKTKTVLKTDRVEASYLTLLGVSANGRRIYVSWKEDGERNVYAVKNNGKKKVIGTDFEGLSVMSLNGKQILFNTEDGTYLSRNGKKGIRMTSGTVGAALSMMNGKARSAGTVGAAYYVPSKNLLDECWMILSAGNSIKYSVVKFARNPEKNVTLINNVEKITDIRPLKDGKTVIIFKDGAIRLTSVKYGDEMLDKAKEIVDDVKSFVLTEDEKRIYFVNDDRELFVCKPVEDASYTRVGSEYYSGLKNISDKLTVYQSESGTYYGVKGSRKKLISEDSALVGTDAKGAYFRDEDGNLFYTTSLKKAKKVKNK